MRSLLKRVVISSKLHKSCNSTLWSDVVVLCGLSIMLWCAWKCPEVCHPYLHFPGNMELISANHCCELLHSMFLAVASPPPLVHYIPLMTLLKHLSQIVTQRRAYSIIADHRLLKGFVLYYPVYQIHVMCSFYKHLFQMIWDDRQVMVTWDMKLIFHLVHPPDSADTMYRHSWSWQWNWWQCSHLSDSWFFWLQRNWHQWSYWQMSVSTRADNLHPTFTLSVRWIYIPVSLSIQTQIIKQKLLKSHDEISVMLTPWDAAVMRCWTCPWQCFERTSAWWAS